LEQETVNNLTDNLTRLQSTLEKGFRINDFEWVKEEILSLSSDPNLSYCYLLNEKNEIIAAHHLGLIQKPLKEVLPLLYKDSKFMYDAEIKKPEKLFGERFLSRLGASI